MKETKDKKDKNSLTKAAKSKALVTSKNKKLIAQKDKSLVAPKDKSLTKKDTNTSMIKVSSSKTKKEIKKVLKTNPNTQFTEYYDLPYRYNETVIKILAQTPHALFIYWDISDSDRNEMMQKYGENFFNETKPILLVHNQTLNCSFEVEIDDFANSWYLRTPTSNCVFKIELGRKYISEEKTFSNIENQDNILHIAESNTLESPNDHILDESFSQPIFVRNIKTNELEEVKVTDLKLIKNIYNTFKPYNDELTNNPSSNFKN